MTRTDFIKKFAALGVGAPFLSSLLTSCHSKETFFEELDLNFTGKILIVGAGAAGLIAGHILAQNNIAFEILEASSVFGGRVKKIEGFADFPIDLGAEWIHTDPSILAVLKNDPSSEMNIETLVYRPEEISIWKDEELKRKNIFSHFYSEYKFKKTTWYDFFDTCIVPGIEDKITYNSPVSTIDYSGEKVSVQTSAGAVYEAEKVLVTVPLNILKNNTIDFQPPFPSEKTDALNKINMPDGIKVFIEFSERFYPDLVYIGGVSEILGSEEGEKLFYDAAFRKDSEKHILGLFTVGDQASVYTDMESEEEVIAQVLRELDQMFEGNASKFYLKHVIQNWTKEPYIQGSYSHVFDLDAAAVLQQALDDKVYFSGEAFGEDSSTVHGAGESSFTVLQGMLT